MSKKSKLKVLEGGNVSDISDLRKLEIRIDKDKFNLSYKDLYIYAFHFYRYGAHRKAGELLNRIDPSYFKVGIYKDLCSSLFFWTLFKTVNENERYRKNSEFFLIVRKTVNQFPNLSFKGKPYFAQFTAEFNNLIKLDEG